MLNWFTKRKAATAPGVAADPPAPPAPPAMPASPSELKRIEGNAHLDRSDLDAAGSCYAEAVRLDERSVAARINLAYVLMEQQCPVEAEPHLLAAAALDESNVDVHYMLGGLARGRGDLPAAMHRFERSIELRPDFEPAYRDACLACAEAGEPTRAEALLRRGVAVLPGSSDLRFLLGNVLQAAGRSDAAIVFYREAIARRPDHVDAHANLAVALRAVGELEQAVAHLQSVAAFRPKDFEAQLQYGIALQSLGRHDESVESFRRAVALDPTSAVGLSNLGSGLAAQGRPDDAVVQYRRALEVDATHYFAHAGLGVAFNDQGRPIEAVQSMRQALALNPDSVEPHTSLLFLMSFVAEPVDYLDEARRYGEKVSARARPLVERGARATGDRSPLRVGLVSGDLRNHPVAAFLESVLTNLDRGEVEIHAYTTTRHDDEVTARIRRHCSGWFSIAGMHDEAAARRIRDDGIDVLIDLAGHTGHNRLTLFAWRPAPVQVTWLGYLASTGLAAMDYVLVDRVSVPEAHQGQFVEKVWYMPHSLYCFTSPTVAPPVGPLPAIASGSVTFGSFQRMNKISDASLEAWARVLEGAPGSRLRLQCKQMGDAQLRAQFVERLQRFGIPPERVELVGPVPDRVAYLAGHAQVDIVLDTFPYPGITTTCEALWMGVPTVTLAGNTLLSRQGASLLHCVELDDWVAADRADYIARAIAHATDLPALSKLRAGLRERARASPLFDAPRFARDFEAALRGMCESAAAECATHDAPSAGA